MKKILFACVITLTTITLGGCKSENKIVNGKCHIMGTINPKFNGKKIFLVPMTRPATMETVDSMVVADGKFVFTHCRHGRRGLRDLTWSASHL